MEKKREIYAEWLRIFAAFIVVFQHTVTSVWYSTPVSSSNFLMLNFMNSISRFGVGVFIMISGAFMLSPKYPHPPQKVLRHNLVRILALIVFWVLFYGIVDALCAGIKNGAGIGETVMNVVSAPVRLFTTPATHLWFLYTIAGLYLITPALRIFTEHASKRMVLYVIAIFFAFGLVLPTVSHLLSKWFNFTLYNNIGIPGCTTFAGYYLTGFYITHHGIGKKARRIVYAGAILSWVIALFYSTYISLLRGTPNEFFFGNFRPTTFLMAVGVFCLFHEKFKDTTAAQSWLVNISKCTLGVYIVHPLCIRVFYGLKLSLLVPHPLLMVPLMALLFFGISLGLVSLLRHIPGIRKFL